MSKELITLPVLASAYKGKRGGELLTHLGTSNGRAACGKSVLLADEYAHTVTQRQQCPTCPRCAKKWEKLTGIALLKQEPLVPSENDSPFRRDVAEWMKDDAFADEYRRLHEDK